MKQAWWFLNQQSLYLFGAGVLISLLYNYYWWRRDQATKLEPQPLPALEQTPLISILVAAWNESSIIEQHISAFLALTYPNKQLVLCAGGNDDTLEVAQHYADARMIIVIEQDAGEGKQAALRKAFPFATGEIIYLTDADCLVNDDAFVRIIAPIVNGSYVAVNGSSRPLKVQEQSAFIMYQWAVDYYANLYAPHYSSGLLGRNCAVRADVLRQTGGFNAQAKSGTDYTLARQLIDAGYTIYNEKQSWVETDYPATLGLYYFKRSRWLRNTIVLGFQKKDYGSMLPSVLSSVVGIFMLLTPFAAIIMGPLVGALWLVLILHAILSRLRYVLLHRQSLKISPLKVVMAGLITLPFDFYIAATTLLQVIIPQWRTIWR